MLFGHTHRPYHRTLAAQTENGEETTYRHAVNVRARWASRRTATARACYVLLTVDAEQPKTDPDYCRAEFVRVVYDVEEAARAVEASPLPGRLRGHAPQRIAP